MFKLHSMHNILQFAEQQNVQLQGLHNVLQFAVIRHYRSSTSGAFLTRVDLRTICSSGSTSTWGTCSGWTTGSTWSGLSFVTISSIGSKPSLCSDDSLHSDPSGTRSLLKNEELRVTFCPWLVLAVIMLPFLATIVIGRDSYGAWAFDAVNGLLRTDTAVWNEYKIIFWQFWFSSLFDISTCLLHNKICFLTDAHP